MDQDNYDGEERVTQTTRRSARQTERLRDTDESHVDPLREDWRRSRSRSAGHARRNQTWPASRQEAIIWLQHGGWRIVAIAAAVVFIIILVLVLNQRSRALPDNILADDTTPTSAVTGGLVLPTQPGDPALAIPPPATDVPAAPAEGAQFQVTGTSTDGLFLRPEPNTDTSPITTIPEGSVVTVIGDDSPGPNYNWKHVRAADGSEGWVAADFLQPVP